MFEQEKREYARDVEEFGVNGALDLWQFNIGTGWLNCTNSPQWAMYTKYRRIVKKAPSNIDRYLGVQCTPTKPVDKRGGLKIYDLEQAIMQVWTTVDDLELPDISRKTITELLEARCKALWDVYEEVLKNGHQ